MKVFLAGYNLDADLIEELRQAAPPRQDITPETLSAAYARISRDPRPINELRRAARQEVEKARKSNQNIIFRLGHSSVAEHAVFNFDVLDITRRALEELEKFRLVSFTEKSQRYITLDSAYHLPAEFKGSPYEQRFVDLAQRQNELYYRLFEKLKIHILAEHAPLAQEPKNLDKLEGWAKEDARYITSLAVCSQAGMTVNARNLEKMLRRFASHPLQEIRSLGQALHALVKTITPSIIKYPEANPHDQNTYSQLRAYLQPLSGQFMSRRAKTCVLLDYTRGGDVKILAALAAKTLGLDWFAAQKLVKKLTKAQKQKLFRASIQNMELWDQVLREYELADLTFQLVVSASCFAQLKRHRMATILAGNYDPGLGLRIPPAIVRLGLDKEFGRVAKFSSEFYAELHEKLPAAADYVLTNAHQRRVICKVNLRELYHISRLREDAHAQWDIREIAALMCAAARKALPLTAGFLGGKDAFDALRAKILA